MYCMMCVAVEVVNGALRAQVLTLMQEFERYDVDNHGHLDESQVRQLDTLLARHRFRKKQCLIFTTAPIHSMAPSRIDRYTHCFHIRCILCTVRLYAFSVLLELEPRTHHSCHRGSYWPCVLCRSNVAGASKNMHGRTDFHIPC